MVIARLCVYSHYVDVSIWIRPTVHADHVFTAILPYDSELSCKDNERHGAGVEFSGGAVNT